MTASEIPGKPPRPYLKSGVYTLKKAVRTLGSRALPTRRTALGRALREWRARIAATSPRGRPPGLPLCPGPERGGASDFGALHVVPDVVDVVVSSTIRLAWATFVPPTPWARVKFGANVTDTCSAFFLPLAVRL